MTREDQIREVERGFSELVEFAGTSWSNIAIVAKVNLLREAVIQLYRPTKAGRPRRPLKVGVPLAAPRPPPPPPEPFEPVHVDETTRWG